MKIIKEIVSFMLTIVVSLLLALGIRQFILSPVIVSGSSMDDTLQDGEILFQLKFASIERFDVVIFESPIEPNKQYVKRIIGVEGDTIAFKNGKLILNGVETDEPYLESKVQQGEVTADFTLEQVTGEAVVPKGKVFVMGDNRNHSTDGRRFGFIDQDKVTEVNAIIFPFNKIGLLKSYKVNEEGKIVER